jgi:hypothetical protein
MADGAAAVQHRARLKRDGAREDACSVRLSGAWRAQRHQNARLGQAGCRVWAQRAPCDAPRHAGVVEPFGAWSASEV